MAAYPNYAQLLGMQTPDLQNMWKQINPNYWGNVNSLPPQDLAAYVQSYNADQQNRMAGVGTAPNYVTQPNYAAALQGPPMRTAMEPSIEAIKNTRPTVAQPAQTYDFAPGNIPPKEPPPPDIGPTPTIPPPPVPYEPPSGGGITITRPTSANRTTGSASTIPAQNAPVPTASAPASIAGRQSINPNAPWGLQMMLNQMGYMQGPMANASSQLYNNYIPYMQQYFNTNNPGQYVGYAGDMAQKQLNLMSQSGLQNQTNQYGGNVAGLLGNQMNPYSGNNYGLSQLYQQIMANGMPNQRAIENLVPGALQQAGQLSGGNGQYGVNDLLSQVMLRGLPQQRTIEGLIPQAAQEYATGGLNPQFIEAMRQQVLQPTQEATQGSLNRQLGGVASIPSINESGQMTNAGQSSGLAAELMRRNERDFMNNMVAQGMANKQYAGGLANQSFGNVAGAAQPYVGMAANQANQGIQNALAAYGIVPQSVAPFTAQASQLAQGLGGQGLQNYLAQQGTLGQVGNQYLNLANMLQSGNLGYGSLLNQNYLGNLASANQLANTALGGDYQLANTQALINNQNRSSSQQNIGQALAMLAQIFAGMGG